MSWDSWPPFTKPAPPNPPRISTILNLWKWIIQLWLAAGERAVALTTLAAPPHNGPRWPKHNFVWDRGVITAITPTSITIGGKTWDTTGTFNNPWASVNLSDPQPPGDWDVVIHHCDPRRVIHVHVDAISAQDTLAVPDLTHFVTERLIPTLGYCLGKTAFIIKRGGIWSSERIPAWPNDNLMEAGTASLAANDFIEDKTKHWKKDQFAGDDVMYLDTGGTLRRATVNSNTNLRLLIATSDAPPEPTGEFFIIKREAMFQWGRISDEIFRWSRSVTETFKTHLPNDTVGDCPKAKITTPVGGMFPDPVAFDVDLWTDVGWPFDEPDQSKNPDVTKTLRYLQVFIEEVCRFFVPPRQSYHLSQVRPATFTFATLLAACGINATAATTGSHIETTGLNVALGNMPWQPIEIYYCIQDANGQTLKDGKSTWHDGILEGDFSLTDPADPELYVYENRRIILSLGWTRNPFRDFMRRFEQTVFVPDLDESTIPASVMDPPTPGFPGKWVKVTPHTHYLDHTPLGFVGFSTAPRDLFAEGDLARWVGFNAHGPGLYAADQFQLRADSASAPLAPYYDKFYVGGHPQATADLLKAQLSGIATSGDIYSLTDTTKDWFGANWYSGGVLRTESGTFTGSNNVHPVDSTKAGNPMWDDADGRFADFILEVEQIAASGVYNIKRPINDTVQSVGKLYLDAPYLPFSPGGKNYRIREPKWERNRYRDRKGKLTYPDRQVIWVLIRYNDDNTLWFSRYSLDNRVWKDGPLPRPIEPGTAYLIDDPIPGGVWLRKNGEWTVPTGLDLRYGQPGIPFRLDQRDNLPHKARRFGRFMIGDGNLMRVCLEIYTTLNMLVQTLHDFSWTSRLNPAIAELNLRGNQRVFGPTFENCEEDFSSNWVWDEFDLLTPGDPSDNSPPGNPIEEDGGNPICAFLADSNSLTWGHPSFNTIIRRYAYGVISIGNGDTCPIGSRTDFYVKCVAPFTDLSGSPMVPGLVMDNRCSFRVPVIEDGVDVGDSKLWTFDANGDAVACSRFSLFSSANTDYPTSFGVIERRSGRLGSNGAAPPHEPAAIEYHSSIFVVNAGESSQGWEAVEWFAITDWSFKYRLLLGDLPAIAFPAPGLVIPPLDLNWWWWWER